MASHEAILLPWIPSNHPVKQLKTLANMAEPLGRLVLSEMFVPIWSLGTGAGSGVIGTSGVKVAGQERVPTPGMVRTMD